MNKKNILKNKVAETGLRNIQIYTLLWDILCLFTHPHKALQSEVNLPGHNCICETLGVLEWLRITPVAFSQGGKTVLMR